MKRQPKILVGMLMLAAVLLGVSAYEQHLNSQKSVIVLATTTSIHDSGLLDYLIPNFEAEYGAEVRVVLLGTGQALETAGRGDADIVLVHSRRLELEFVDSGYGIHRVGVMYNDFVIIGPEEDPAGINGLDDAAEALRRIAEEGVKGGATFISRADRSGTHMMELSIWDKLGMKPSSKAQAWYLEAGAGMGTILRMADEKKAYTLTDRATWLTFKSQLANLRVLVQGDPALLNPYAIILVNPEKHPNRNYKGALTLAKWIISREAQELIESFRKEGEILFTPIARNFEKAHELGFPHQEEEIAWYDSQNP
ncbi:MAG: substrate-binding domain-containing protein [Candidatus Bathyarchaeia archaeon]